MTMSDLCRTRLTNKAGFLLGCELEWRREVVHMLLVMAGEAVLVTREVVALAHDARAHTQTLRSPLRYLLLTVI